MIRRAIVAVQHGGATTMGAHLRSSYPGEPLFWSTLVVAGTYILVSTGSIVAHPALLRLSRPWAASNR
jgi:hypothetical protein